MLSSLWTPHPKSWHLWVGKHRRDHLVLTRLLNALIRPAGKSTEASRDSVRQNIWLLLTSLQSVWPKPMHVPIPERSPAPLHRGPVTYPRGPGSGTARSWGCTPGFRPRTHTGRSLPRFHKRLRHTRRWAVHIRSHLEKGAQTKSNGGLSPLLDLLCRGWWHWLRARTPSEQSSPAAPQGRAVLLVCMKEPWKCKAKFPNSNSGFKEHPRTVLQASYAPLML